VNNRHEIDVVEIVGIKAKGGRCEHGSASIPKVPAAKAPLDLEPVAVFDAALFLSVHGPVRLVANGCLGVLVVPVAVVSLGAEALAALNDADPALVFGRARTDGGLFVLEVSQAVAASSKDSANYAVVNSSFPP